MVEQQKTIKREFTLTGVGLHTGCKATVCCKPAPADSGISFIRTDLPGRPVIQVRSGEYPYRHRHPALHVHRQRGGGDPYRRTFDERSLRTWCQQPDG